MTSRTSCLATRWTLSEPDSASAAADSAAAAVADSVESAANALRPFSSLLSIGDIEGTFLVSAVDRPIAEHFLDMSEVQRAFPRDQIVRWGSDLVALAATNYYRLYVLQEDSFLTGEDLEDATAGRDPQFNQSQVQFQFSRAGGRQFSRFSGANVGNYLAIVLDNEVMSAPVIRDRIGARGQIDMGQGTPLEEARDLALVLRAGALPARVNIIEERTVGPSFGQDSIDQGRIAGMVGIVFVILVMIGYYGMAGMPRSRCSGCISDSGTRRAREYERGFDRPWHRGSDSVDWNGRRRERSDFRTNTEELALGRANRTAVDEGFQHALSAIVDANITTLITALDSLHIRNWAGSGLCRNARHWDRSVLLLRSLRDPILLPGVLVREEGVGSDQHLSLI